MADITATLAELTDAGDLKPTPYVTITGETSELVNVRSLKEYCVRGADRRPEQLKAYVGYVEHRGKPRAHNCDIVAVPRKYRQLGGTGRAYASWLSLQNCTRECRKASLQLDGYEVYELEQQNAHPTALLHFLRQSEDEISQRFKLIELFCAMPKRWTTPYAGNTDVMAEKLR